MPTSGTSPTSLRSKTPETATRLLVQDFQRAAACVTAAQLATDRTKADPTAPASVSFYGRSRRVRVRADRWIYVAPQVEPIRNDGAWRAYVRRYVLAMYDGEDGNELIGYHHHPPVGVTWPQCTSLRRQRGPGEAGSGAHTPRPDSSPSRTSSST